MLTSILKTTLIGAKTAAIAALLATTAAAQQAVPTPEGNVVIVPDAALQAEDGAAVPEIGYATLTGFDNDQAVAETLVAQGFTGIVINRTGNIMTVSAQRAGVPTTLVYSLANGRLISVDGVDFPHPADAAAAAEAGAGSVTNAAPGSVSVGDDGTTDGEDTAGGTENDGGAGADDGADDGSGSDAGPGGDAAGEGGSDGGSDGGADGESDSNGNG